ncbi:MAG: hypothetical protein K2Z81_14890 [Cyanobacteria bacterium]|nr:hypothetical protein [Cyanobacteriota bacterium]
MDVFQYLEIDEKRITDLLHEIDDNFAKWPMDQVFSASKKAIRAIQLHFDKLEQIVNGVAASEMDGMISMFREKKSEINELISDKLVMIHIDEPGFEELLEQLAKKVENLFRFCDEELYPTVKSSATDHELQSIKRSVEDMVLS